MAHPDWQYGDMLTWGNDTSDEPEIMFVAWDEGDTGRFFAAVIVEDKRTGEDVYSADIRYWRKVDD